MIMLISMLTLSRQELHQDEQVVQLGQTSASGTWHEFVMIPQYPANKNSQTTKKGQQIRKLGHTFEMYRADTSSALDHTSPANNRGRRPRAEQGASRRTRSKLLGRNPFDFSTLPPEELFRPGPFLIFRMFFLSSALLVYFPFCN